MPQPVVVLFEVLLEKDPGRRFQNPAELLKALPTITGAIDAASRLAIWQGKRSVSLCPSGWSKPRRFAYFCLRLSVGSFR